MALGLPESMLVCIVCLISGQTQLKFGSSLEQANSYTDLSYLSQV